jgi:hypothetical protein
MMAAVHRYGGYVAQSTGDGIFALFGAPVAHEDHPQRALHAALAMQEELRRYADRLRADGKIAVEARVGVNTGEVVVRTIETGGHTEYTPVGHVTNLAARMQTAAPAGSIAASEATQRLCARLLGLDMPTKVAVTDPDGGIPLETIRRVRWHHNPVATVQVAPSAPSAMVQMAAANALSPASSSDRRATFAIPESSHSLSLVVCPSLGPCARTGQDHNSMTEIAKPATIVCGLFIDPSP